MKQWLTWLVVLAFLPACDSSGSRDARPSVRDNSAAAAVSSSTGYVDSAMPIEEALRRFRRDLPEPSGLRGGATSKEKLVQAFVRALEARDTSALRRMTLTAAEFAWLYYPWSRLSRPPYELPPALMWFQLQGESEKGASRLLGERAGASLGYVGHSCAPPRAEGENRIHAYCELRRVTQAGDTLAERLFGLIVERKERYKFLGYANKL